MNKNRPSYSIPNAVNYVVKRALGASLALAAGRRTRKSTGTKTRTNFKKNKRYGRKAVNTSYNSVVLTKRRKTFKENHSTENRSTSLQVRARPPSAYKLAMCGMEPQWYRVQGLSQYDTSTGFYPIANRLLGGSTPIMPLHFWDITACMNTIPGNPASTPVVGYGASWTLTGSTGQPVITDLGSQDPTGATIANSFLVPENISGLPGTSSVAHRKSFHEWSHIKMNLYGVRKRATRWVVQLVQVKEVQADFISAAQTNLEKRKLFDYLVRPFVYNNLNMGDPQTKSDIKILKTYETIIDPITTDQYAGETAVPKIQTLNWFIKHNRVRYYDWRRGNPGSHLQAANWDEEIESGHDVRVDPKYRVYLLIRALSPEQKTVLTYNEPADPISEPSYDLVMRQKFLHPT